MRTLIPVLVLISTHTAAAVQPDDVLVDHHQDSLGFSVQVPKSWLDRSFVRGKSQFFPGPADGAFIEISLIDAQNEDYSSVDLEFFMFDLLHLSDKDQKVKEFSYRKTELSGLPAYDASYSLERDVHLKIRVFFASANDKIYLLRYQSLENQFADYESVFIETIVPSFKIKVVAKSEARYQVFDLQEFGISFYYPSSWRVVETRYSRTAMPVYSDPNTGMNVFLSSMSASAMNRTAKSRQAGEGVMLGSDIPVLIACDPDSYVTVTVLALAYRYEAADAIEGLVKGIRDKAKKMGGFEHLRQFPIQLDGRLAMEYTYAYREGEGNEKKKYFTTHYITHAGDNLYDIRYVASDENFSKHVKEVERLVKYLKIRKQ